MWIKFKYTYISGFQVCFVNIKSILKPIAS